MFADEFFGHTECLGHHLSACQHVNNAEERATQRYHRRGFRERRFQKGTECGQLSLSYRSPMRNPLTIPVRGGGKCCNI